MEDSKLNWTEEAFENCWNLMKSRTVEDRRMGAMLIMNLNWEDNWVLLHLLICNFHREIRNSQLSTIPGWSKFANTNCLDWRSHYSYSNSVISLFKDCKITQEQIELIHKLLNQ